MEQPTIVSGFVSSYRADPELVACWTERDKLLEENAKLKRQVSELLGELEQQDKSTTRLSPGERREDAIDALAQLAQGAERGKQT